MMLSSPNGDIYYPLIPAKDNAKMIKFINPDGLLHTSTFSQVVTASGSKTIYTSGQVAVDEHGNIVEMEKGFMEPPALLIRLAKTTWSQGASLEHH